MIGPTGNAGVVALLRRRPQHDAKPRRNPVGRQVGFAALLVLLLAALLSPAGAVQPDEMLSDPALEGRAREISEKLRCPVCQSQSIDESNAELARDLRLLVRERLRAGDNDEQVLEYLVARYGEYVLLEPKFVPHNWVLWFAPLLLLLGGLTLMWRGMRRRAVEREPGGAPE